MRSSDELAVALSRTYSGPDPWERVQDYHRYLEFIESNPQKGSSAVASAVDLPRGTVRQWMNGSKPDPVHAIETAEEMGWLTATTCDQIGRALNVLIAGLFSGGSINETFQPTWTFDREPVERLVSAALENVGTGCKRIEREELNCPSELTPEEHRVVLGRLLAALGAPKEEKNEDSISELPSYLEHASSRSLVEFAKVYLLNRAVGFETKDTLQINEVRSAGYKQELAAFLSKVAGEPVRTTKNGVVVSAAASRELGFSRGGSLRSAIQGPRTPCP